MGRFTFAVLGCVCMTALACSEAPQSPLSPAGLTPATQAAGPNGETLKIGAPAALSPTSGVRADHTLALTVGNVNGTHSAFPVSYRYELRTPAGVVITSGLVSASNGLTTVIPISTTLALDTDYTWRVRAEYNGAFGPWSTNAAFKSAFGSYIRGNEIFDPLTNGTTAGSVHGAVTFLAGTGVRIEGSDSYIAYELPTNLQAGEYSFMATNVDEGNPGDKSKVMSMGEGLHVDVTDNDYRATLEVRGSIYTPSPGQASFRIITGIADEHYDAPRVAITWNRTDWHFFKIWWRTGSAGYEIRNGSPTGPVMASHTMATGSRIYRPVPHIVYIGAPNTRAGLGNASHPGMIVKNLWVSGNPRPTFPN